MFLKNIHHLKLTFKFSADPHPGNILIRVRPGTKKDIDVVIIDHGLYCHEPESFRESYALLWKSIVLGDTTSVKKIAESWGIKDHELFASFQLFRPYKGGVQAPASLKKTVTRSEMLQLQASVKERIVKMLSDSKLVPPELSLIGRHLNLVRSLNKSFDSPVNRPKIMAVYANRGINKDSNNFFVDASFNFHIFLIEVVFRLSEYWRRVTRTFTGIDSGGFEALLEKELTRNVENKLGFKIPDNISNGGVG